MPKLSSKYNRYIASPAEMRKRLNERVSEGVTLWESPNDANHDDRHAEYDGVEFHAFPHQNYLARLGDVCATIGSFCGKEGRVWCATARRATPDGRTDHTLAYKRLASLEAAVLWLVPEMKKFAGAQAP